MPEAEKQSSSTARPLKIVQVLPALNSGGVERGTVELARELVLGGHTSVVISSGGRMVDGLLAEGSEHISFPVHRKSLWSLLQVRRMRRLLESLAADVVHVRSRAPAWMVLLGWRRMNPASRPRLVSLFHCMYSVNFYSAVMARAEHLIAISDCVKNYITANYKADERRISLIPRGLDPAAFNREACTPEWKKELFRQYPQLQNKHIILMPGRLTRWKGQEAFLEMMSRLIRLRQDCHGVVVGDAEPGKQHYFDELLAMRSSLGLDEAVTFVGHRSDIAQFYGLASVTCHMSNKEEPFGRTVPESLASGTPVVAYDRGGASESLNVGFPQGLVAPDDIVGFAARVADVIDADAVLTLPESYYLSSQLASTLAVYRRLLAE